MTLPCIPSRGHLHCTLMWGSRLGLERCCHAAAASTPRFRCSSLGRPRMFGAHLYYYSGDMISKTYTSLTEEHRTQMYFLKIASPILVRVFPWSALGFVIHWQFHKEYIENRKTNWSFRGISWKFHEWYAMHMSAYPSMMCNVHSRVPINDVQCTWVRTYQSLCVTL